jgi:transposase
MRASREAEYSTEKTMYLAFELSTKQWKLGFSVGDGRKPRRRTISAGDLTALGREISRAKDKLGVSPSAPVKSCYEAGLDGFWLHHCLTEQGISNVVVDSSSIEVSRRAKHAKTDRLDVEKLVQMLIRYDQGEPYVWHVVNVPSVEAEDRRHLHRQLQSLKEDYRRHANRIWGVLRTHGVDLKVNTQFLEQLKTARQWDGTPLPPGVLARVQREYACVVFIREQIKELEAERRELIAEEESVVMDQVRRLMELRGIGENGAWLLTMEFFSWREFENRRQVGALAGLTPTPYQSGESSRDQGISKAGNRPVRAMIIELAWCWLRYQPESELTQWYRQKFDLGGKRRRKIGIVALARKLLVALWRYLESGTVPAGAQLKPVS